jgi:hypothetical protein
MLRLNLEHLDGIAGHVLPVKPPESSESDAEGFRAAEDTKWSAGCHPAEPIEPSKDQNSELVAFLLKKLPQRPALGFFGLLPIGL